MGIEITQRRTLRNRPDGYNARLGPIEGSGRTRKDAHGDLITLVEQAISGSYQPEMIQYGSMSALVYRDPFGWHYQLSDGSLRADGSLRPRVTISVGEGSRGNAVIRAKSHVAQIAYPGLNGLDLLADTPAAVLDHCHWLGFQRAYEDARSRGVGDNDSHRFACNEADNRNRWLSSEEMNAYNAADAAIRP